MLYLATMSIFVSVALITGVVLFPVIARRSAMQERLSRLGPQESDTPDISLNLAAKQTRLKDFLARLGGKLPLSPREQPKYVRSIVSAGFRKENVLIFFGCKLLLALVFPVVFLVFYALPHQHIHNTEVLLYLVGLAILGFLLPSAWLHQRVTKRKLTIFHTFPDILDLLAVCVEAGLGIDAAIVRVTRSPQFAGNPLVDEFILASREMRAGKPRIDTLKDMAERTMVEDIRTFVNVLIQTERFGTSIAQALRVLSDSLRTKRKQMAEEAAAKTAIKMVFPLVFCVFPAMMIVILGPAVFGISKLFK